MLEKLKAVESRYEELCARSEQPDFYADPQKAAKLLREKTDMEPIVEAYHAYNRAVRDMEDAQELMADPEMAGVPSGRPVTLVKVMGSCVSIISSRTGAD